MTCKCGVIEELDRFIAEQLEVIKKEKSDLRSLSTNKGIESAILTGKLIGLYEFESYLGNLKRRAEK